MWPAKLSTANFYRAQINEYLEEIFTFQATVLKFGDLPGGVEFGLSKIFVSTLSLTFCQLDQRNTETWGVNTTVQKVEGI